MKLLESLIAFAVFGLIIGFTVVSIRMLVSIVRDLLRPKSRELADDEDEIVPCPCEECWLDCPEKPVSEARRKLLQEFIDNPSKSVTFVWSGSYGTLEKT